MQRLGVMGGTFDPIHVGHLVAASEALHSFELDSVTFVPAGEPWQKSTYAEPEDRLMMTVLGAASHSRFRVSRIEIDRKGPTYTADTMDSMRSFYGGEVELLFIVGADAALKLGTWVKVERLAEVAEVVAVTRTGFDLAELSPEVHWPK
ncbi:MAG: nicotinate-nucleotide adenylyltransferase, partial [Actinomycetota bacterium]